MAVFIQTQQIGDGDGGLAEEDVAALVLQPQQRPLDGADALGRHVPVGGDQASPIVVHVGEHGAQVLKIDELQAVVVRHTVHDVEDTRLDLCKPQ